MKEQYPACFYRVSAKGIILFDDKLLLIREGATRRWDLPGGGIEHLEEIENAFRREIEEELGADVVDFASHQVWPWITYDNDPGWEKPILYLVYKASLGDGRLIPGDKIAAHYFSRKELDSLLLEKHLERFREQIISIAFGSA